MTLSMHALNIRFIMSKHFVAQRLMNFLQRYLWLRYIIIKIRFIRLAISDLAYQTQTLFELKLGFL